MEFHWYYLVAYAIVGMLTIVSNGWLEFFEDPWDHPGLLFTGLLWPIAIPILLAAYGHQYLRAKKAQYKLRVALAEKVRIAQEKEIERIMLEEVESEPLKQHNYR